jgi:alpha-glucosidase
LFKGEEFTATTLPQQLPLPCPQLKDPPFFDFHADNAQVTYQLRLAADDAIWGLGETMGPVNKRGGCYRLFATDQSQHLSDLRSLYGSHPFFIIDGATKVGVLIDSPGEINLDLGFLDRSCLAIALAAEPHRLIFFNGQTVSDIISIYLKAVGRPYLPPKWAFGYHQSRWSYPSSRHVRDIAARMREEGIPCDAIFLDIDYMDDFKVFTTSQQRFADLPDLIKDLKKQGMRVIPIVDPGVKIEPGYAAYDTGVGGGFFIKNHEGAPAAVAVWPGYTHLPDFLRAEVREYWANLHQKFIEMGFEGFWNDMNEPALFFTTELIAALKTEADKFFGHPNPGIREFFKFDDAARNFAAREEAYRHLYHTTEEGQLIPHVKVHNVYAYFMAEATALAFARFMPGRRYFLISRASCIGSHRRCGVWTGDNHSWWEHLLLHMKMLVSLNMCGFFFVGADVGGFGGNATGELVTRWSQLAVLSPFFRNHAAISSRPQEPWAFDSETLSAVKQAVRLRYALLPHLYSEFMLSVMQTKPVIRSLWLEFPEEPGLSDVEDQILYGSSLMIAPIIQQSSRSRTLRLPHCRWLLWRVQSYENRTGMTVLNPGTHSISVAYDEVALLIRENSLIATCPPQDHVTDKPLTSLTLLGFVTDRATLRFYDDDGISDNSLDQHHGILELEVIKGPDTYCVKTNTKLTGNFTFALQEIHLELYDAGGTLTKITHVVA